MLVSGPADKSGEGVPNSQAYIVYRSFLGHINNLRGILHSGTARASCEVEVVQYSSSKVLDEKRIGVYVAYL
jgi:hypothetical protein